MQSNINRDNNLAGVAMNADRLVDARGLAAVAARYRDDRGNRADAQAAIDSAIDSVGLVLESALAAMAELRSARAVLTRFVD
ncbi:hypothetical protein [Burkholderia pseudomallei]|uniref:hypothetical protein n=1 Tax=Burkholderia pseudomallei TaxID=28450 RepID=UPI0021F74252|nr:hypothetical protein [Burkholderia pseudomallei]MCW0030047.1 hypothetical protein [Burkholderia pseudomallei]MCW0090359.1 hypothetical protein [Burkholderia pseudomallei]MCW0105756.1 hypothetical protein [Burkholderia pseudomallei]